MRGRQDTSMIDDDRPADAIETNTLGWRRQVGALGSWIAAFIVPPVCLACRERLADMDSLCPACWSRIDFIRPPLCDRLGLPMPFGTGEVMVSASAVANPPAYDRARAVARFDGVMRDLVHGFKYADRHEMVGLFARWLADAGRTLMHDAEVIVPVPLARSRLLWRRYNQSALLAAAVAASSGKTFAPLALKRIRKTPSQVGLTPDQRQRNVAGAFAVPPSRKHLVDGRNVLLVDDVITTGATVEACARALRRSGARRIDVLALALVT